MADGGGFGTGPVHVTERLADHVEEVRDHAGSHARHRAASCPLLADPVHLEDLERLGRLGPEAGREGLEDRVVTVGLAHAREFTRLAAGGVTRELAEAGAGLWRVE